MEDRTYYEDQELRITAIDIRCKHLTIRTNSVTSVGVASARPMKWLPWILLLGLMPVVLWLPFFFGFFGLGQTWGFFGLGRMMLIAMLIGYLPMACLVVLASLIRVSRIYVYTSGGAVVLAAKIQLTDATATLARFQSIKEAIEQAMGSAKTAS
jgi:hypothetical protein